MQCWACTGRGKHPTERIDRSILVIVLLLAVVFFQVLADWFGKHMFGSRAPQATRPRQRFVRWGAITTVQLGVLSIPLLAYGFSELWGYARNGLIAASEFVNHPLASLSEANKMIMVAALYLFVGVVVVLDNLLLDPFRIRGAVRKQAADAAARQR
jgi:hypothetical protein